MASPPASTAAVRGRMRRQARRDTAPEMLLRSELHRRGLRYRVDRSVLPGSRRRPDIVFANVRVAVFVHGCFWHACPIHGTQPTANAQWWQAKLARNVERDRETREQLEAAGWVVVEVWEHDDPVTGADTVECLVSERRSRSGRT